MLRAIVSFLLCIILSTTIFAAEGQTAPAGKTLPDATASNPNQPGLNIAMIDHFTHLKGHLDPQTNTYKISVPRDDLTVVINGVKLTSAMGLTSWAIFKKTSNGTALKADLVVTENQVNTVMSVALDNNLSVTALHNHLLWESPLVMFLHVEGTGTEKSLATAMNKVFTRIKDTNDEKGDFPLAEIDASDSSLTPDKIDAVLKTKGAVINGVYKVSLNRTANSDDPQIAKSFGISAAATFAGSNEESVIDGNLAMQTVELQKVLQSLHKAGIVIVALHQQVNRDPNAIFVHYFGVGKAETLARGLRNAIDGAKLATPAVLPATAVARNMTLTMPGCAVPFTLIQPTSSAEIQAAAAQDNTRINPPEIFKPKQS
jgi:hypothetical protein